MNDKVTWMEKLSFAVANLGNIPIQATITSFLMIFYTNVVGLNPAACATLFLIARILDGVNDPFIGYIIDHLPGTKWGRFRPPLVVGTLLCSLNFLLLWFGPMLVPEGKLVVAYISYILIGILFPVMDISLNSMLPVMTENMKERNTLSSIKGASYMVGTVAVTIFAPIILGNTSNKQGYIRLILIITAVICIFSIVGTAGLKERVKPVGGSKYGIKDILMIFRMRPVWVTFVTILFASTAMNVVTGSNTYFYTYIMGDLSLLSLASVVQVVGMLLAAALSGVFISRLGKKRLLVLGVFICGFFPLIRLMDVRSVPLLMVGTLAAGFGAGLVMVLNYGIQADNTDYVELKSGKRAEAAVASLSSFITKCAMGIGGAIPGYLLAWKGFDEKLAVQSPQVNGVIILCITALPACICVFSLLAFGLGYPLTKKELEKQNRMLEERHKKTGTH